MKRTHTFLSTALLLLTLGGSLSGCHKKDPEPTTTGGNNNDNEVINTPATAIPDELVGTWFADSNTGPLTVNWDAGTFQGEQGFREFRTMVFTKDGKNAVEYTSEVFNGSDEVQQRLYKVTGTLEYQAGNPSSLTFHAQSGVMRVFSNKYTSYKEAPILKKDMLTYASVLRGPEATTFTSSTNYLTAKRVDGANLVSVKYRKVGGGTVPTNPGGLYTTPPTTGTYVQVGSLYYPTVSIGSQEWMSVNYAGNGGIKDDGKPHYGAFLKFVDLAAIPVPAGWRIPTRRDYEQLLASQGLALDQWGSTNGEDLESKRRLGRLMATTGWLKQDGYATNSSGFTAVPANLRVTNGSPNGEGTNCLLWTSEKDASDNPLAFQIIQLPSDTYASIRAYPVGYNPPHLPVRLVRDK